VVVLLLMRMLLWLALGWQCAYAGQECA